MRTVTMLLGVALALAAPASGAQSQHYGSYLSGSTQENLMVRDGLDADEMIGGEVRSPAGERLGSITDLMTRPDGAIERDAVDIGQGTGQGGRHVAVDLADLTRTEQGPVTFTLELDPQQLAALPAYRLAGDRWQPMP